MSNKHRVKRIENRVGGTTGLSLTEWVSLLTKVDRLYYGIYDNEETIETIGTEAFKRYENEARIRNNEFYNDKRLRDIKKALIEAKKLV